MEELLRLLRRLAHWLRLSSHHAELQAELAYHRELVERDLISRGISPADVCARARRTMGNETYMREEARAVWVRPSLEAFVQDATHSVRGLRRDATFTAAVIGTLALGIGATGAVYSILQAALLQPLPYRDPSALVVLERSTTSAARSEYLRIPGARKFASPTVLAWRRLADTQIGEIAAFMPQGGMDGPFDIALGDRTERLNAVTATPNFFQLLGVSATHGRVFNSTDEQSSEPLIVLSDALWRRRFGANPAIVGQPLTLTGGAGGLARTARTFTIAGILPRGFHYTYPDEIEAWVLMRWSDVDRVSPNVIGFSAVARLRPGISLELARQRADEVWNADGPPARDGTRSHGTEIIALEPMHDWVVGETRPALQLLGIVAVLLLLITCVTVANGLLARFSERRQELAVRTALGAGHGRLVRQLLTEGAVLSVGGAAAGTLLVMLLMPVLRSLLPASVPRIGELDVNANVIVFGAAMAAVTTVLAAVAPAWGGARLDAAATLTRAASTASAGRSTVRWRQWLVGLQAAIGTALLISASLLLASFWALRNVPLGFDGQRVMSVEVRLLDERYAMRWAMGRFQDELITRLRAIPGVDAATTSSVPFAGGIDGPVDLTFPGEEKATLVRYRVVDPAYFRVLRVPVVHGRLFTDADRQGSAPVTVISESLARRAFGTANPIGKTIGSDPQLEVVGVVADLYYANLERDPLPSFFVPRAQDPRPVFSLLVRADASLSSAAVTQLIRREIRAMDPALPVMKIAAVDHLVEASVANRRFYTVATAAFAAIALLLTTMGLGVVVARVVAERRRELAIRAALGAPRARLLGVATRDAMRAAGLGVLAGLAGAYAASGLLAQFLFQVAPRSVVAYGTVGLLVLIVAALAASAPMHRFFRASLVAMLKAD